MKEPFTYHALWYWTYFRTTNGTQQCDFANYDGYEDKDWTSIGDWQNEEVNTDYINDYHRFYYNLWHWLDDNNVPYSKETIFWDNNNESTRYDHKSKADIIHYNCRHRQAGAITKEHGFWGISINNNMIDEVKVD